MRKLPRDEYPELVDWEDTMLPPDSRAFGFGPALALGALTGIALLNSGYGYNFCYPRSYYGWRDYYTCSPKYICRPAPYMGGEL
ncbi:MAG: hypothetical protein H6Q70_3546 [Firmicutes bacterium]|nr:hypothetical protein [Bacillota bacterium]